MDSKELIDMLNRDFADEHAAIIRYLVHAYQEGEDTPMGASLLSRSREEMWHMHWLGMIIGRLGGEPTFVPGPYPFDPTSRATLLKSYIEYEKKLIPHYHDEAEKVDDPHIRRVLHREAWESEIHARRFQRLLDKLSPEDARGLPKGGFELPPTFLETLQAELNSKYNEMLQHLRLSWLSQKEANRGWALMDQSMEKMKQLALFAEAVAEDGAAPRMKPGDVGAGQGMVQVLHKALGDVLESLGRHTRLQDDAEFKKHSGLVIKMDLAVQQESWQAEEMKDWLK
ncbi:ferritin-like domain-containing protein [Syntrophus aciditrophicus]|jgi:bacterioferritin|nr:ferritin-like domain-containing protein [Syntrophus aciditrophicus]